MSPEQLVLLYASLGLFITTFLIALNNIREEAEKRLVEPIDFAAYINNKAKGDAIDKLIADHFSSEKLAA